VPPFS